MGKVKIPVCGSGFLAVIKNKTGKYNIVMAENIRETKSSQTEFDQIAKRIANIRLTHGGNHARNRHIRKKSASRIRSG